MASRLEPTFFAAPSEFRAWLEKHHAETSELWIGLHKKGSGRASITWPQAVDVALCFGWIDGVRKGIDEASYAIRFTPRRPGSTWSAVNVRRVEELTKLGLMCPAGLAAFAVRREERSGIYAYEQEKAVELGDGFEQRFRANSKAWDFFQVQAPWYRRTAIWWVISAKREETRLRRLATLIEDSEQGRPIRQLARPGARRPQTRTETASSTR